VGVSETQFSHREETENRIRSNFLLLMSRLSFPRTRFPWRLRTNMSRNGVTSKNGAGCTFAAGDGVWMSQIGH
jgi:hypothetical protein